MKHLLLVFLVSSIGFAQSITKQVIGTAGKTQTNSNLKVSWTTGESVVGLMTDGGNQLGNGYYAAMYLQALSILDNSMDVKIKVYPNPTSQMLFVTHPELTNFQISISDFNGKQLYSGAIQNDIPINISYFIQGVYMVTIDNNQDKKRNTYKIIKN